MGASLVQAYKKKGWGKGAWLHIFPKAEEAWCMVAAHLVDVEVKVKMYYHLLWWEKKADVKLVFVGNPLEVFEAWCMVAAHLVDVKVKVKISYHSLWCTVVGCVAVVVE